jgi:hypothetical protein
MFMPRGVHGLVNTDCLNLRFVALSLCRFVLVSCHSLGESVGTGPALQSERASGMFL